MNDENLSRMGNQPAQELREQNPIIGTRRLIGMIALVLCGALPGFTTYGQPSVSVAVSVPLPGVEIRAESDFYEPLTPYGEWVVVGSYGRCWRPGRVEAGWRPYCTGYWQRTEAGWYWASDEPWAWATYHYGRWNFADQYGWYWVPQTQWAPAWVSWHSGGGYVGWAPLYPSGVRVISPRAYVFVEERHFMEPVRPSTVVVNNTTIINKTVIIEAPATTVIEKASGRKVQALPVQELRHREEAAVVARQRAPASASQQFAQTPVRSEAQPSAVKGASAPELPQAAKPVVAARTSAAPAPQKVKIESQPGKPASSPALGRREAVQPAGVNEPADQNVGKPVAAARTSAAPAPQKVRIESQPGKPVSSSAQARPEAVRPAAIKEPAGQNAGKVVEPPRTPPQVSENKAQPAPAMRAKHEQLAREQGRPTTNKGQTEKVQEQPAKPAAPPSSQ